MEVASSPNTVLARVAQILPLGSFSCSPPLPTPPLYGTVALELRVRRPLPLSPTSSASADLRTALD